MFKFDEAFPRIAATLDRLSSPSQDYVLHPAIVDGLLQDHGSYLEQTADDDSHHKPQSWWASNMVQWFSKEFTEKDKRFEYYWRFERKKNKQHGWAYRKRPRRAF